MRSAIIRVIIKLLILSFLKIKHKGFREFFPFNAEISAADSQSD